MGGAAELYLGRGDRFMAREENQQYGAGAGLAVGATAGAIFGGPAGAAIGAGLGSSIGGMIGGLFGGSRKVPVPDISAELARISGLFAQARQAAIATIEQRGQAERGLIASNLAARGILRSPVSEAVFARQREAIGQDIAAVSGQIAGQEGMASAQVLQGLMASTQRAQFANLQLEQQRAQAITGSLGAIGGALLSAGLNSQAGAGRPGALPSGQGMPPLGSRFATNTQGLVGNTPQQGQLDPNFSRSLAQLLGGR